jgi:hypothetical protein
VGEQIDAQRTAVLPHFLVTGVFSCFIDRYWQITCWFLAAAADYNCSATSSKLRRRRSLAEEIAVVAMG